MDIILIPIILVAAATLFIGRRMCRVRNKVFFRPDPDRSADESCLMLVTAHCRPVIDKALECFSRGDEIAVCRNHRLGSEILDAIGETIREYTDNIKNPDDIPAVYHSYMLDATERIAELSRTIITSPSFYVPISYKCEIQTIRESVGHLLQSTEEFFYGDGDITLLKSEAHKTEDFLSHSIRAHSREMSHGDFNDGTLSYHCLMLLCHLHSFISSLSQGIKRVEINDTDIPACGEPATQAKTMRPKVIPAQGMISSQ